MNDISHKFNQALKRFRMESRDDFYGLTQPNYVVCQKGTFDRIVSNAGGSKKTAAKGSLPKGSLPQVYSISLIECETEEDCVKKVAELNKDKLQAIFV